MPPNALSSPQSPFVSEGQLWGSESEDALWWNEETTNYHPFSTHQAEDIVPSFTKGAPSCPGLYRERQVGLKCGLHAVNAVLAAQGKKTTREGYMDLLAANAGFPSNGDDYAITVVQSVLEQNFGINKVGQIGSNDGHERSVHAFLRDSGVTDGLANGRDENQFTLTLWKMPWVICLTGYHYKAFVHHPNGVWCNLDSVLAASEVQAPQVKIKQLKKMKCQAIVYPVPEQNDAVAAKHLGLPSNAEIKRAKKNLFKAQQQQRRYNQRFDAVSMKRRPPKPAKSYRGNRGY